MMYIAIGMIEAVKPKHDILAQLIVETWVSEFYMFVGKRSFSIFRHVQERVVLPRMMEEGS